MRTRAIKPTAPVDGHISLQQVNVTVNLCKISLKLQKTLCMILKIHILHENKELCSAQELIPPAISHVSTSLPKSSALDFVVTNETS